MNKKSIDEYNIWRAMKARCYSSCNKNMGTYQKNKITVCKSWINNFDKFYEDMGPRPSKKHSIDRINNMKGYTKNNCKWSTQEEQCKNRGSFNKIFTYEGKSMVLKDWARKFNIPYTTLYLRIYKSQLPFQKAITKDPFKKMIEINGEHKRLVDWCRKYNRKTATVSCRISEGWDKVKAILTPTDRDYNNKLIKNK